MKIVIISNSPESFTGFGGQMKLVATELKKRGHDVEFICSPGPKKGQFVEHHFGKLDLNWVDDKLEEIGPDAVICLDSAYMLSELMRLRRASANCHVFYWFAYEGNIPAPDTAGLFRGVPPESIVHLSDYAKSLWGPQTRGSSRIYHCEDSAVFRDLNYSDKEVRDGRNKWARRLKQPILTDAPLLININRNFWHKRWDACFSILKLLKDTHKIEAQLICHCAKDNPKGGFNLPLMEEYYGIKGQIIYTDFDWLNGFSCEELNELYNISDLRLDTTEGEGFGLSHISAGMARCPQVVNRSTTAPELLQEFQLVPPNGMEWKLDTVWAQPDCHKMAELVVKTLSEGREVSRSKLPESLPEFEISEIVDQWEAKMNVPLKQDTNIRGHKSAIHDFAALDKVIKILGHFGRSVHNVLSPDHFLKEKLQLQAINCNDEVSFGSTSCDVAVLENCFDDLLAWAEPDARFQIMQSVLNYRWLFTSDKPRFKWGQPRLNSGQAYVYMPTSCKRRKDLEAACHRICDGFDFQIWDTLPDKKEVPEGLI